MAESVVAIQKGERGYEPVYEALDLIPFTKVVKNNNRVVIKVNFITDKTWDTGATTDPLVVDARAYHSQITVTSHRNPGC